MIEQKKKEIDGVEYGLMPISPIKSSKTLTRLIKMGAGPILNGLSAVVDKSGDKSVLDGQVEEMAGKLASSMSLFFEMIPEDEIERLAKELLAEDRFFVDGKKMPFTKLEGHLSDKGVMHFMKLVWFSLEVNFSDFLDVFREKLGPAIQGVLSSVKASTKATGGSGA